MKNAQEIITIGLVEDQFLFREGIKAILSAWPAIKVIFESPDGFSVMQKLRDAERLPDVMLVDLSLPPDGQKEFNGLDLTAALKLEFPEIRVLILSVYEDNHFISQLLKKGAHGYLVKDSSPQEVINAITEISTKGLYINDKTLQAIRQDLHATPQIKRVDKTTFSPVVLTRREEEILELICQQKTTDEIAGQLFISPKTVNGHRNNLLQKTSSRNVAGLVTFALSRKQ